MTEASKHQSRDDDACISCGNAQRSKLRKKFDACSIIGMTCVICYIVMPAFLPVIRAIFAAHCTTPTFGVQ